MVKIIKSLSEVTNSYTKFKMEDRDTLIRNIKKSDNRGISIPPQCAECWEIAKYIVKEKDGKTWGWCGTYHTGA